MSYTRLALKNKSRLGKILTFDSRNKIFLIFALHYTACSLLYSLPMIYGPLADISVIFTIDTIRGTISTKSDAKKKFTVREGPL